MRARERESFQRKVEALPAEQRVIFDAVERSKTDFRTSGSLSSELGKPEEEIRAGLNELKPLVRHPISEDPQLADWYRAANKGLTWRERWRHVRAIVSHTDPGSIIPPKEK